MKLRLLLATWLIVSLAGQSKHLTWAEHSALSWDDFNGRAPRTGSEPSAVTDTGFRMQLMCRGGLLDIEIAAEFSPGTSWVRENRKFDRLLKHEQGHFDITELYARRMRKAIREAHIKCEDDRKAEAGGKRAIAALDAAWGRAQKQYDAETDDGLDDEVQDAESDRIAKELAELKEYAR
jgi:hypothetical protein